MKRPLLLMLSLLLLAACSGGQGSSTKAPSDPAPAPAPPPITQAPAPEPAPPPDPTLSTGPIWLLSPPREPLWAGPVSVVVENSPGARPQAGLQQADLVVEALAESEISRFLAFYWSTPVAQIGPVRSARSGTIAMADAYNAPYAHSGGSAEALAILASEWGPRDLDEIYTAGYAFYRAADRSAPHNLYTTTELLGKAIQSRKIAMEAVPTTARSAELPKVGEAAQRVVVNWHRLHQASWVWEGDSYRRFEEDKPHQSADGNQLAAVNLLFLEVNGLNRGPDLGWTLYLDQGGPATILVAGHQWEGSWRLEEGGFRLYPKEGDHLPLLAPGSTWVHMITQESSFEVSGK